VFLEAPCDFATVIQRENHELLVVLENAYKFSTNSDMTQA
jgi:hypothetical protein